MNLKVIKTTLSEILYLREMFFNENNFQVRYNACHERGWTDSYFLTFDDSVVGYGSTRGQEEHKDRDTIFEFYLVPPFRKYSTLIFHELIKASGAIYIECQSNEPLLTGMLYEFSKNISSDVILFKDHAATDLTIPHVIFRKRDEDDQLFQHNHEPEGDYILETGGEVVATGGFLLHYNKPFADLYMEVHPDHRRKGFGSLLIQEVKKACYLFGRIPAARCGISNKASKATMLKAGMSVAGYMLLGEIKLSNA